MSSALLAFGAAFPAREQRGGHVWLPQHGGARSHRALKSWFSTVKLLRVGAVMAHVGCPSCRLRFTSAAAAYLAACPKCGRSPQSIAGAEELVGFSLFVPENDASRERPEALAISIPVPDPADGGS